jgi:phage-related tail fiber protein
MNYYSLVTQSGFAAESNAKGSDESVNLTEFAVGDSAGVEYDPTGYETALVNERYRGAINNIIYDPEKPNQFILEGVVPEHVGGFTIREAAFFTDTGICYGIAKYPPSYKSAAANGAISEVNVRIVFVTDNTATINLLIDPSVVLATRDYADNVLQRAKNHADEKDNHVEIAGNVTATLSKLHIFTAAGDLQIPESGTEFRFLVDDSVVLSDVNQCRLLAPSFLDNQKNKIKVRGVDSDICEITESGVIHSVVNVKGIWKV